jgi:hypothetical protein
VPLVFAVSTTGLSFAGNTVEDNDRFASWKMPPFILRRCGNFRVSGNRVTRGGETRGWSEKDVDAQLSGKVEIR